MSKIKNEDRYRYPSVEEAGIVIPPNVVPERFRDGFDHSIRGGQITKREQLKQSFRYGFRAGRLFLRDVRKSRGILEFPMKAKVTTKVK